MMKNDAANAMRKDRERFRVIFDNSFQFICLTTQDGTILEINQTTLNFFKIEASEIIGKYFWESPWIASTSEREWLRESVNIAAQGEFIRFETQALVPDGQLLFVDLTITPIKDDRDIVNLLIIEGRDRSVYKQIDEALQESENKYRTIFETSKTALAILGNDAIITEVNKEFERLSGYSAEEIVGKKTWMDFTPKDQLHILEAFHAKQEQYPASTLDSYEATLLARDGKRINGLLAINPIPGANRRVAVFLDLTELKNAQRRMFRAEKMAALGNVMAGVAHEINNPNNFIYFNLPVLREYLQAVRSAIDLYSVENPEFTLMNMPYKNFFDDVFHLLDDLEHGSSRITKIVSELRNYIRGHDEDYKEPGNIATVVQHTLTLVKKHVQKMVKEFEVNVVENLPLVMMNSGKIEQVLINLIINAGHAADKDDSWIRVSAGRDAEHGNMLLLAVEDNGAGISKDILDRIFEPFFTTRARESGIGLGLAISQRIIEEHHGEISVQSTQGQSTCFTVQLPIYSE